MAAGERCVDAVTVLLDKGADVNVKDSDGRTPLIIAAAGGMLDVARVLLQRGADMDATDALERSAWMYASMANREEMAALFKEMKARSSAKASGASGMSVDVGGWGRRWTAFARFGCSRKTARSRADVVSATLDELSAGDVVIKTAASSVNYKDALAATGAGKIIRRFPLIAGIDVAGTVASSADSRFREGEPVLVTGYDLGVAHDGGYAEFVRVPADWVVPIPTGLSPHDAMAIGTAGFTAALSLVDMELNGLKPGQGPVIVTGATGGVGSVAVQLLAARGYQVTALTGKDTEHDFLRSLGANDVLSRNGLQMGTKPLEKPLWAGAVDVVGGETLAWLTRTMMYGGCIASSGPDRRHRPA